jgi:hypothetical protein
MPVRAARSVRMGWPHLGLGDNFGSECSVTSQTSSGNKRLVVIVISERKLPRAG